MNEIMKLGDGYMGDFLIVFSLPVCIFGNVRNSTLKII